MTHNAEQCYVRGGKIPKVKLVTSAMCHRKYFFSDFFGPKKAKLRDENTSRTSNSLHSVCDLSIAEYGTMLILHKHVGVQHLL